MKNNFSIFLLLVLASYSIGHKVITVPLARQYANDMQVKDGIGNDLNPYDAELKDINEDYVIDVKSYTFGQSIYPISLWFPGKDTTLYMKFILDTGSSWLSIPRTGCKGCIGDVLPPEYFHDCEEQETSIRYGTRVASGKVCNTSVAAQNVPWYTAKDMKVLAIDSANITDLQTYSNGILGLAPSTTTESNSFVAYMKKQNLIDIAAFGIDLTSYDAPEITFGGVDTLRVPGINNFSFTDLYDDSSWSVAITSMKYGDLEFGGQVVRGILDTASIKLMLPTEYYKRLFNYTTSGKQCSTSSGVVKCKCQSVTDGSFEPLFVTFGGFEYKISPEKYLSRTAVGRQMYCNMEVLEINDYETPTVVLGHPLLREYYVYYDMDNKRVGLYGDYMVSDGLASGSNSGDSNDGNDNTKDTKSTTISEFNLIASLLGASLILNLIFLCVCCICCIGYRRRDDKEAKDEKEDKDEIEEPLLNLRGDMV